jgi:hypothetical protein
MRLKTPLRHADRCGTKPLRRGEVEAATVTVWGAAAGAGGCRNTSTARCCPVQPRGPGGLRRSPATATGAVRNDAQALADLRK